MPHKLRPRALHFSLPSQANDLEVSQTWSAFLATASEGLTALARVCSSGPLLLEAPKDQRQRWAAILAADPNFAHFIRPLHEDLSAALTPYTPQDGFKAALPPYTPQDDDTRGEEGALVPTPIVAEEQAEQVVKKAGGLEELIAFAEALCLRAEKGDLMTGGGPTQVSPVCKARTVDMELRMEVRTQGLQGHGGRPTGKVAVGAKVS